MIIKILFLIVAIGGVVLIFKTSWFWSLLLVPMVVILLFDGVRTLWGKKS